MKILYFLAILAILLQLTINPIYAVCCRENNQCNIVNGEICNFFDSSGARIDCDGVADPLDGQCEVPSGTNPDFRLPRYADIPELSGFEFPGGAGRAYSAGTLSVGLIITALLPYAFAIAGLLLLFYLIYGAFTYLSSFGNPQGLAAGSTIIIRSLIGFTIIFAAYWLVQIAELVLGLNILGT